MAPFAFHSHLFDYLMPFLVGIGFGAALESNGFGNSLRLTDQFYLRNSAVLKVMFTAILTAAALLTASCALGLLDANRVWFEPTFLWPEIAGGLIMGVGFVLGGYCPGTSLVASATLKLDGMSFLAGAMAGILAMDELMPKFEHFFYSGYLGHFTVGDLLGVDAGWALLAILAMALAFFWAGEVAEQRFGKGLPFSKINWFPMNGPKWAGLGALLALGLVSVAVGQPNAERRWQLIGGPGQALLDRRAVDVSPREVVDVRRNPAVNVLTLDVRGEDDFRSFHLRGAERVDGPVDSVALLRRLKALPENSVVFLIGNDEGAATEAWKRLFTKGVPNLYVVEGGVNGWLGRYPVDACLAKPATMPSAGFPPEALHWTFERPLGDGVLAAHPDSPLPQDPAFGCEKASTALADADAPAYEHKVKVNGAL